MVRSTANITIGTCSRTRPFFLDDPVNGDQIDQADRRWIYGGRVEIGQQLGANLELKLGSEGRYDDVRKVSLYDAVDGQRVGVLSAHSLGEGSAAGYAEATWTPAQNVRVFGGLRGDYYSFDVTALDGTVSGSADDSIFSPKLGLAYKATDYLELYANWGQGFHSNDARGVAVGTPPVPGLIKGEGEELGSRLQIGQFSLTATYWWLQVGSELIFVGDSNSVEPKTGSTRNGYELVCSGDHSTGWHSTVFGPATMPNSWIAPAPNMCRVR